MSDEQLLELLQFGHHRYFSILTDRYEKYILQRCKSYVKDAAVAADLCRKILIKIFLQFPTFRREAKFSTCLSIINRTCVDYIRKSRHRRVYDVLSEKLADEVIEMVDFDEEIPVTSQFTN